MGELGPGAAAELVDRATQHLPEGGVDVEQDAVAADDQADPGVFEHGAEAALTLAELLRRGLATGHVLADADVRVGAADAGGRDRELERELAAVAPAPADDPLAVRSASARRRRGSRAAPPRRRTRRSRPTARTPACPASPPGSVPNSRSAAGLAVRTRPERLKLMIPSEVLSMIARRSGLRLRPFGERGLELVPRQLGLDQLSQVAQALQVDAVRVARQRVGDAQRADALAARSPQRVAGVEAHRRPLRRQRVAREPRVRAQVADHQRPVALDRVRAQRLGARELLGVETRCMTCSTGGRRRPA